VSPYRGCTAITPNRAEAEAASGRAIEGDDDVAPAAEAMASASGARQVLVTRGDRGLSLWEQGRMTHVPARAREVYDVTGAGDTVIAYFALGLAAGVAPADAAFLANAAGSVAVSRVGTTVVAPEELVRSLEPGASPTSKILDRAAAQAFVERERSRGRRIVFTNGCFDLLHAGHVHLLDRARGEGDLLVVAVNSDASIRRLKGPERPLVGEADRTRVLAALDAVGAVVVFEEDTPLALIQALRPDVLVKGGDYAVSQIVGADWVQAHGGRVATIPLVAGRSTSALVEAIRQTEREG
jgi:D-beta-D-heptose 7-phosphate kinase/D-beta-D-heptose 1-phosphate adenosyltransferase